MLINKIRIILAIALLPLTVWGQQSERPEYQVLYKFYHHRDTANLQSVYTENMVLFLARNSSVYRSYDKLMSDSVYFNDPGHRLQPSKGTRTAFYFFLNPEAAYQHEVIIGPFVFPIEFPEIQWTVHPDTMMINEIKCQKANGTWKGRIYEAWFAPEIPFREGPWKLRGLPGLIIQASDLKKQIIFEFQGFSKYSGPDILIAFPRKAVITTKEDFYRTLKAADENPEAYFQAIYPNGKFTFSAMPPQKKKQMNNPIELN